MCALLESTFTNVTSPVHTNPLLDAHPVSIAVKAA